MVCVVTSARSHSTPLFGYLVHKVQVTRPLGLYGGHFSPPQLANMAAVTPRSLSLGFPAPSAASSMQMAERGSLLNSSAMR